jgi:hypothetical protein
VGFGLACAPCAHPSFWTNCHAQRGAARPPRASQLRCSPQINKIYRSLPPPHCSFADPSGNILGSKLCTGATKGPNFFVFSFFYIVFDLLFLLFSSYSSLLILLVLFFVFLFIFSYILICLLYYRHTY